MIRKVRRLLAVLVVALSVALLVSPTSAYAAFPTGPSYIIYGDQSSYGGNVSFYPGEFDLYSVDGADHLGYGRSGNFAGYNTAAQQWFSSGTTSTGHELRLQTDGNVVVYDAGPGGDFLGQRPLWASGTYDPYGFNYHLYRITMGGSGHFSIWRKLVLDTTGRWTWERWKTFGNGL